MIALLKNIFETLHRNRIQTYSVKYSYFFLCFVFHAEDLNITIFSELNCVIHMYMYIYKCVYKTRIASSDKIHKTFYIDIQWTQVTCSEFELTEIKISTHLVCQTMCWHYKPHLWSGILVNSQWKWIKLSVIDYIHFDQRN